MVSIRDLAQSRNDGIVEVVGALRALSQDTNLDRELLPADPLVSAEYSRQAYEIMIDHPTRFTEADITEVANNIAKLYRAAGRGDLAIKYLPVDKKRTALLTEELNHEERLARLRREANS